MKKILHVAETIKGGVATVIRTISASPEDDAANYQLVYLVPEDQAKELHGIAPQQVRTFPRSGRNVPSLLRFTWLRRQAKRSSDGTLRPVRAKVRICCAAMPCSSFS